MSLRMLLDGPDLRGIIREIEASYGKNFRVVQAEQVRTGGVAGFFAKQHYEVTVEIEDPAIVAQITAQPKTSDIPLAELATRSQNDQAAASAEAWAKDLLQKARELNEQAELAPAPADEPAPADPRGVPLLDESELAASEAGKKRRWKLRGGKGADHRKPSDRMLPATHEQQERLKDLLAQRMWDEGGEEATDLAPADRIVALMDAHDDVVHTADTSSDVEQTFAQQLAHQVAQERAQEHRIPGVRLHRSPRVKGQLHTIDTAHLVHTTDTTDTTETLDAQVRALFALTPREEEPVDPEVHTVEPVIETPVLIEPTANLDAQVRELFGTATHDEAMVASRAPEEVAWRDRMAEEIAAMRQELEMLSAMRDAAAAEAAAPATAPAPALAPAPSPLSVGRVLVILGDGHDAFRQASAIVATCAHPGTRIVAIAPADMALPTLGDEDYFAPGDAHRLAAMVAEEVVPVIVLVHAPQRIMRNDAMRDRVMQTVEALNPTATLAIEEPAWHESPALRTGSFVA